MSARIVPISQRAARSWVATAHRHLSAPRGDLYRTSLFIDGSLVAVGIAGRPCRELQDGTTAEITRIASLAPSQVNACTRLYGALVKAGKAIGFIRFITYTRLDEPGISPKAAGFEFAGVTDGGEWDRPSRKRRPSEQSEPKNRWVIPGIKSGIWPKSFKSQP